MANRHLSRSIVLQTLFEWDFTRKKVDELKDAMKLHIEEFAPNGLVDESFMEALLDRAIAKQPNIDEIITKAAPDWPLEKISSVDRNILRLGLCELLFTDRKEVPAKVAINEAIELAKEYGGETSGKFVNGVLGAVYKEIGEPGKDEQSKVKKKDVPFDQMEIVKKVGALLYAFEKDELHFGLVHDIFGYWTLSKGGLEEGEKDEDGLKRIIKEEMDLEVTKLLEVIGENEYVSNHPEKGKHRKQVTYYLAEAKYSEPKIPEDKGGLDDVRWFKASEIIDLNMYNDVVPLITKSVSILSGK